MSTLTAFFGGIKSIQRGTITIANTFGTNTSTVTSVDTAKSELRFLGQTTNAGTDPANQIARLELTNSTTVTATRAGGNNDTVVSWELIEHR